MPPSCRWTCSRRRMRLPCYAAWPLAGTNSCRIPRWPSSPTCADGFPWHYASPPHCCATAPLGARSTSPRCSCSPRERDPVPGKARTHIVRVPSVTPLSAWFTVRTTGPEWVRACPCCPGTSRIALMVALHLTLGGTEGPGHVRNAQCPSCAIPGCWASAARHADAGDARRYPGRGSACILTCLAASPVPSFDLLARSNVNAIVLEVPDRMLGGSTTRRTNGPSAFRWMAGTLGAHGPARL